LEAKLEGDPLAVTVGEPGKSGTSTLSRHVSYLVTTKPLGYVVRRRFSDFVWLRSVLAARYHGLFIPSLPGKDMVGATYKSSSEVEAKSPFICARLLLLRFFTEGLVRLPFVRSDPAFVAFLSTQDEKEFGVLKEQTGSARLTLFNSQEEGAVSWREGVGSSSPQHWDRAINDFKLQVDSFEKDGKALLAAAGAAIEALGASAVCWGKLAEVCLDSARHEESFGDSAKYEFANKATAEMFPAVCASAEAFGCLHKVSLCQPDNFEYSLRTAVKFYVNQVAAFREYLKIREVQNLEVMKHTARLDGLLNDQRNGKPITKGSMSMFSLTAKKQTGEEILEECKQELEQKTAVLNLMTSALEYSEIDRFNSERAFLYRDLVSVLAASQLELAKEQARAWGVCAETLGRPLESSVKRMEAANPLMSGFLSGSHLEGRPPVNRGLPITGYNGTLKPPPPPDPTKAISARLAAGSGGGKKNPATSSPPLPPSAATAAPAATPPASATSTTVRGSPFARQQPAPSPPSSPPAASAAAAEAAPAAVQAEASTRAGESSVAAPAAAPNADEGDDDDSIDGGV